MRRHEDALDSTSFLDLLSCSLVAVILLLVAGGAERTRKLEPSARIRIGQDLQDDTNHLRLIQVGDLYWYAKENPLSGSAAQAHQEVSAHRRVVVDANASYLCMDPLPDIPSKKFEKADGLSVFGPGDGEAFAREVSKRYSLQVRVEPAVPGFLASAVIAATEGSRGPPMFAYVEICTAPTPHTNLWRTVVTDRRKTTLSEGEFGYSLRRSAKKPALANLVDQEGTFFCGKLVEKDALSAPIVQIALKASAGHGAIVDTRSR